MEKCHLAIHCRCIYTYTMCNGAQCVMRVFIAKKQVLHCHECDKTDFQTSVSIPGAMFGQIPYRVVTCDQPPLGMKYTHTHLVKMSSRFQ